MGKLRADIWGVTFDTEGILRDTDKGVNSTARPTVHKSDQKKKVIIDQRNFFYCESGLIHSDANTKEKIWVNIVNEKMRLVLLSWVTFDKVWNVF